MKYIVIVVLSKEEKYLKNKTSLHSVLQVLHYILSDQ